MRAWLVGLLGALACAWGLALTLAAPQPAFAGCESRSVEQMRDDADATAIGTIVEIDRSGSWFGLQSSGEPVTYWVEISEVFDGSVQELIAVESGGGGLDGAAAGRSYLLFLRGQTPTFSSDVCSSIPLPIQMPEAAEAIAGWESSTPEPGGAELPRAGVPWGTVVLGVVIAAMAVLLVRDVRVRRRRETTSGG
ncbi:hypothetical protein [Pseudactinotalea terrae]|uniref:hypothetical protein n=1 Tax=Pseudactinotalea terrae TaxID=1743262 RepID=UPI0012E2D444|nr:hypothetical protein [Pseudactinotalea terrae]